jgi:hypothetical protein
MNDILDKIKKLLRLGKSANQHEAAAALARAFELARKHQVDLNNVDLEDDEAIERLLIRHGARLSFERLRILGLIKHFFRVDIVISTPNAALIGRSTDLAIAHYVHDFLLTSLRAGLKQFQKEARRKLSRTRRENYIQGWIYGVSQKLNEAQTALAVEDSRYALATTDNDPRIKAAKTEMYPTTQIRKPREVCRKNNDALLSGFRQGESVNIRQPLQGPEPLALGI